MTPSTTAADAARARRARGLGIAFLIASNGLTAAVDATAKYLSRDLHSVQIVWGYFLAMAVGLGLVAAARRMGPRRVFATRRLGLHFARSAMLALTIGTLFFGLARVPLADGTAIAFIAPLVITALSAWLLAEQVDRHRWGAVWVGLGGVLIILRPGSGALHWAAWLLVLSAFFFALFQILTRRLTATEDAFTTLIYTGVGGLLWASLAVGLVWRPLSAGQIAVFAGIGLLGIAAHLCMFRAFTHAQVSLLAPFNYVKLVWVTILGYLVFGDVPGPAVIAGSLVIVSSGLYVYLRERRMT